MGQLRYGNNAEVFEIDDRTLAHLQAVIGSKLRRHEQFFFTHPVGDQRVSVWFEASMPTVFVYESPEREPLDQAWLEQLSRVANSTNGLVVVDPPAKG